MSTQNQTFFKIEKRDGSNWKRVLLTWINHCGFLGRSYFNIEQTNIYEFFTKYQEQIPDWSICQVDLISFLKEYYPAFELHLDDNNQLSASDYMYIYSILLHFCCVKHPTEYFQKICQNFHDAYQQAITTFFKGLLGKDTIDKSLLRKMIAEASLQNSLSNIPIESPIKTSQSSKISPPTPKTHMLEEKSRELHMLKACLETEKYEKGFLELQNKQYEERIRKLEKEHRICLSEMSDLRARINLQDHPDDYSPNKTNLNDQQRNRLQKLVNEKEDLIFNLKQNLDSLSEEKNLTKDKLKYAQNEVNVCLAKISELELERSKLIEDMERKEQTIHVLTEAKKELEDIINESRTQNGRFIDLNNSLEYLDLSSSNNSNSSSSLCCPENLGRTVVDIQLREKECENIFLKSEIEKLQNDNSKLSRYISELIRKHYEIFDICQENLIADEDAEDITHNFMIFENYFAKLVENYQQAIQNIKQFHDDKSALNLQVQNLNEKILDLEKLFNECKLILKTHATVDKEQGTANISIELADYIEKINKDFNDSKRTIDILNEQNSEFSKLQYENFKSNQKFTLNVQSITDKLLKKCEKINEVIKNNSELTKQIQEMENNMQNYEQSIKNLKELRIEKKKLVEENNEMKEKIKMQADHIIKIEKTYESSKLLNEEINEECLELKVEIDQFNKTLAQALEDSKNKQMKLVEINEKNLTISQEKEELLKKIDSLNNELLKLKENFSNSDLEKAEKIDQLSKLLYERNNEIENLAKKNDDYIKNINSLEIIIADLKVKLEQLQVECFEMEKFTATLEEEKQHLNKCINELKNKLDARTDETNSLKTENQTLIDNCTKNSKNVSNLRNQILEMEKRSSDLQLELVHSQELLNEFEDKEKKFELKYNELQQKLILSHERESDLNLKNCNLIQNLEDSSNSINSLKAKIDEFEIQCKDQITEICRLEVVNSTQTASIEELNSLLNQRVEEILSLQTAFDNLKTEYDSENKLLLNKLNNEEIKLNSCESNLEKSNNIIIKLEKENSEFSNTIESLTISKLNAEDEIEEWKAKLDAKNNELKNLNRDFENNFNEIIKQIENNIENFLEPETLVNFLESNLNSDNTLPRLRNAINTLLNNNQSLLKNKEDLEQKLTKIKSDLEITLEIKNNIEIRLNENDRKRSDLESRLVELTASVNSKYLEHSHEVTEFSDKLNTLQDLNTKLKEESDCQGKQLNALKDEKDKLIELVSELVNTKENQLQDINELVDQISTLKLQTGNLTEEKENCLKLISNLEKSEIDLRQDLSIKYAESELLEGRLNELTKQFDDLLIEKNELLKSYNAIQEEKISTINEIDKKNQEIEILQDKMENLGRVIDELKQKEIATLENMKTITSEQKIISQELHKKIGENDKFKEELNSLLNKVDLLTEEKEELSRQNLTLNDESKVTISQLEIENSNYKVLNNQFEEKIKELEEVRNENFKITTENWELKCERDDLSKKLESKILEVDEIREILRTTIEELQDKNRQLLENKVDLESRLKENKEVQNEYEQRFKSLEELMKTKDSKHSNEISNINDKLNNLVEEKSFLEEENNINKMEIEKLNNERAELLKKSNEYSNELNALSTNFKNQFETINQKSAALEKLTEDFNNLKSNNIEIENELKFTLKSIEESKIYQNKYEEINNKFIDLEKSYEFLIIENETMKNDIIQLNAFKDLNTEFNALKVELQNIEEKYHKTSLELNKVVHENQILNENYRKMEETQEKTNKNLEKKCLRLGEEQAKSTKLGKDNELLKKSNNEVKQNLEYLQQDYIKLQNDCKSLRTKISDQEKDLEFFKSKNEQLLIENEKLSADYVQIKESAQNLQKLNNDLQIVLQENGVNLNHLTVTLSEMTQLHDQLKADNLTLEKHNKELQETIKKLNETIEEFKKDSEILRNDFACNLEKQLENACEENSNLTDKYSKIVIQLDIANINLQSTKADLDKCRDEISNYEREKRNFENSIKDYQLKIDDLQSEKEIFTLEKMKEIELLKETLIKTEDLLQQKENKTIEYCKQIELLKSNSDKQDNFDEISKKYQTLEQIYNIEKSETKKLKKDLDILHAKLQKSRQINDEHEKKWLEEKKQLQKLSDEKIKENRVELEGKLEKMKNKMKTLYNEEVTKLKKKYENEIFDYQAEIQVLKGKCEKYDQHIKSLSKRVVTLNEKVCELERDNKFMECKLKDYDQYNRHSLRPHRPQSTMLVGPPVTNFLGSNLRMEDEEGEIFNNTYLADVRTERVSDFGIRDSISAQELQYRNSLAPPHLRSAYLAQYKDTHLTEEDIKDGMPSVNLDDSLTSLMSGHRKKIAGTTSYKKPGPPTPSKSGGRLSFGGSSEVHASILKEYNENEQKKTPAKFKLFSSRSNTRDEKNPRKLSIHQRQRQSISRKYSFSRTLASNFSSTPRKSKIHFDNRRTLEKIMNGSVSNLELNKNDNENNENSKFNKTETNENVNEEYDPLKESKLKSLNFSKWRPAKQILSSESGASDTNSPYLLHNKMNDRKSMNKKIFGGNTSLSNGKESDNDQKNKLTKTKRRISIYHRGNVYARSKLPSNTVKEQIRAKAKIDRNKTFNKYRKSLNEIGLRKSLLSLNNFYKTKCPNNCSNDANEKTLSPSPCTHNNDNPINKDLTVSQNECESRLSEIYDKDIQSHENLIFHNKEDVNNIDLDLFQEKISQHYDNPKLSDIGITNNCNNENNYVNDPSLNSLAKASSLMNYVDSGADNDIGVGSISNMNISLSSNSNATQLNASNRTLYASSNIVSRKIPQINSTIVSRKTSFYYKNGQCILIANEALTFLDIIKLWINQKDRFKMLKYHFYLIGLLIIAALIYYITL